MKKKWNKPAQFKRALAILFTAVLIFQAVPMQSAISMTANAEETTEESRERSRSKKNEVQDSRERRRRNLILRKKELEKHLQIPHRRREKG